MRDLHGLLACCALTGVFVAQSAGARESLVSPLEEHLRLTAGLLSATTQTDFRLDADDGTLGTDVSAEDDLGLRDQSEMGDVELELRIRERHRVRFNYFRLDRRATTTIARQIQFGNNVFDPGDVADSRLDWREFSVTYGYTILRRARYEIYGSFGLHIAEVGAAGEVDADNIREEQNESFPLPAVGAGTLVRITDRFHAEARVGYLSVNYEDLDATIIDLRGAVLYRFNRNLALGAAYVFTEREGTSEDVGDSGHFELRNDGPELFLRVTF